MTGEQALTWADYIGTLGALRQELAEVDTSGVYELTIPHLAATEEEIAAAEARLGHPIDAQYREFLRYANGWPEFFYDSCLLGTNDLGTGELWQHANDNLDVFYESLPEGHPHPPRNEVEPISADPYGSDVFAIWRTGELHNGGHPVIWYPAEDSEPLADFFEFFSYAYQVHKDALEKLKQS